jgi:hypothetical protein
MTPELLDKWFVAHKHELTDDQLVTWDELHSGICCGGGYQHDEGVPGDLCRTNTQYVEELRNWQVLCAACKVETDAYWDMRWDEYFRSVM